MSIPTYVAAGTLTTGTGAISPAMPAGIVTDDVLIMVIKSGVVATPITLTDSGAGTWTTIGGFTGSHSNNGLRGTWYWSRYDGLQTAPTTLDAGDNQLARIYAFRGCVATGNPINNFDGDAPIFAETTSTLPGFTTTANNCLILDSICGELPDSNGTGIYSTWTNTSLATLTERTDDSSATGVGGSIALNTGTKAVAGVVGTTTVTHNSFRVAFKKIALTGIQTPPTTGFGTDTTYTPPRATINGVPFFPRIAFDSGESSNFADISVAALNLGQYRFTHYLNYQFGPLSKVLPQTTPLPALGMYAFATGNQVTAFPALAVPTTGPTGVSGAAGNVNVGTHSYKVSFTIVATNGSGNHYETNVGPSSAVVTVSTSAKQVDLTAIPLGVPGCLGRKIYRTVAGDTGNYKLVVELTDNTTTTYTDNVADASLGANAPTFTATLAIITNDDVSGTPMRTHYDTRAGAGGWYLSDEPQAEASGYQLPINLAYWRTVAASEMPHTPLFMALFPEGPLVPETFAGSGVESQYGDVGYTEHVGSAANVYWWCRYLTAGGNDWIGDDIYRNFRNETDTVNGVGAQGGFPRYQLADRAAFTVAACAETQKVPVLTVQLFGPFQQGRFPTNQELWSDVIMAIAEGIRGLAWWQIGTNLGLRDQTEPTKTNATNALIEITAHIANNEATLLTTPVTGWSNSTQSGTPLAWRKGILPTVANACRQSDFGAGGRGAYQAELNALNAGVTAWSPMLDQNGNVRMRVFRKNASTYLIYAYNYHPAAISTVTITGPVAIRAITVVGESRTIAPSGNTFQDNFGGSSSLTQGANQQGHIYEVTVGATVNAPPAGIFRVGLGSY